MLAMYKLTDLSNPSHPTTLAEFATEVFNLIKPGTAVEDPALRQIVFDATRKLNPAVNLVDENGANTNWIYVPILKAVELRIPAAGNGSLRTSIEGLGYSDARAFARAKPSDVVTESGSTLLLADVQRLVTICRMMRLAPIGPTQAELLIDDAATSLVDLQTVADATQTELASILDVPAAGIQDWRDTKPWAFIQWEAGFAERAKRPKKIPFPRRILEASTQLSEVSDAFCERSSDPRLSQRQRNSAKTISALYRVYEKKALVNEARAFSKRSEVIRYRNEANELINQLAIQHGVVPANAIQISQAEAAALTKAMLLNLTFEDVQKLGGDCGQSLIAFTYSELNTAAKSDINAQLSAITVGESQGIVEFEAAITELRLSEVSPIANSAVNLSAGMFGSPQSGTQIRDLSSENRSILKQNLSATTLGVIQSGLPAQFSEAGKSLSLEDLLAAGVTTLASKTVGTDFTVAPTSLPGTTGVSSRVLQTIDGSGESIIYPIDDTFIANFETNYLDAVKSKTLSIIGVQTDDVVKKTVAIAETGEDAVGTNECDGLQDFLREFFDPNWASAFVGTGTFWQLEEAVDTALKAVEQSRIIGDDEQAKRINDDILAVLECYCPKTTIRIAEGLNLLSSSSSSLRNETFTSPNGDTSKLLESLSFQDAAEQQVGILEPYTNVVQIFDANQPQNDNSQHKSAIMDKDFSHQSIEFIPEGVYNWCEDVSLQANTNKRLFESGLNYLGLNPTLVPVWTFDYLVDQSRYFGNRATSLQARTVQLYQQYLSGVIEQIQAEYAIELTKTGVQIAAANTEIADKQITLANRQIDVVLKSQDLEKSKAFWSTIAVAATVAVIAAPLLVPLAVTASSLALGVGFSTAAGAVGLTQGALAATLIGGGASATATVAGSTSSRSKKQELRAAELSVAHSNKDIALAQKEVALLEEGMAQLRSLEAGEVAEAVELKQATTLEILVFLKKVANDNLTMANRIAWLAERAYIWEHQSGHGTIKLSYQIGESVEAQFLGSEALLTDLDTLVHNRLINTAEHHQLVKMEVSLRNIAPGVLNAIRQTGQGVFKLSQDFLDQQFPGLYHHNLRKVEMVFDGLLPAGGVSARLSTNGMGYLRVKSADSFASEYTDLPLAYDWPYPNNTVQRQEFDANGVPVFDVNGDPVLIDVEAPFIQKPIVGRPMTSLFSAYKQTTDQAILRPPEGSLQIFENFPINMDWRIEIPPSANDFSTESLADIRLQFYFSALYSSELAQDQFNAMKDVTLRPEQQRGALISASISDPSTFSKFRSGPAITNRRRAPHVPLTLNTLPENLENRAIRNITGVILGSTQAEIYPTFRFAHEDAPFGVAVTPTSPTAPAGLTSEEQKVGGMFYSGIDDLGAFIDVNGELKMNDPNSSTQEVSTWLRSDHSAHFPNLKSYIEGLSTFDPQARWTVKLVNIPIGNTQRLRSQQRQDDGTAVLIDSGVVSIPSAESITHSLSGGLAQLEMLATIGVSNGTTLEFTLQEGSQPVVVQFVFTNTQITVNLIENSIVVATNSGTVLSLDSQYEVRIVLIGGEILVMLDGQKVLLNSVTSASGGLKISTVSGLTYLHDVTVYRLRYDGMNLGAVLDDPFDSDLGDWTASAGATYSALQYTPWNLQWISDILLQIDYVATPKVTI